MSTHFILIIGEVMPPGLSVKVDDLSAYWAVVRFHLAFASVPSVLPSSRRSRRMGFRRSSPRGQQEG